MRTLKLLLFSRYYVHTKKNSQQINYKRDKRALLGRASLHAKETHKFKRGNNSKYKLNRKPPQNKPQTSMPKVCNQRDPERPNRARPSLARSNRECRGTFSSTRHKREGQAGHGVPPCALAAPHAQTATHDTHCTSFLV